MDFKESVNQIVKEDSTKVLGENLHPALSLDGFGDNIESFKVYRENTVKIYIPRFYGIEKYGIVDSDNLDGSNTSISGKYLVKIYKTN